jgi:serine/threonine-protein kinase
LADFGIALHPDYPNSNPGSHPYTQGYGSPEQMKGKPLDSRSDMYALAATLWVLLTGNPKLGYQQLLPLNEPDLKKHRPDVPDELEKVLKKALAEERNRRFKSIKDFREALENSMVPAKDPITPEPASPVPTVQPRPISLPVKISRTWIEVIAMVASITLGLLKIDPVLILPSSVVFGVMLIGGFVGLWRSILLSKWVSLPLFFLSLIAAFVFSVMGFFDITMVLLLICFWTGTILPFATLIPER